MITEAELGAIERDLEAAEFVPRDTSLALIAECRALREENAELRAQVARVLSACGPAYDWTPTGMAAGMAGTFVVRASIIAALAGPR